MGVDAMLAAENITHDKANANLERFIVISLFNYDA